MEIEAQENQLGSGSIGTLRVVAIALATISLLLAVAQSIKHSLGYINVQVLLALPSHPQAFLEFVAEGFGGSLALPAIHIGVASFFKSQRSSRKRWKILLGWSIALIFLSLLRRLPLVE